MGQQKCVVMVINHTIKRRKYLKIFWFCFIHRNLTRIQMYIVSWPNTKHWLMNHISNWVMIMKWRAWLHDKCHACKHIEAETRWPPFPRRRFQMHFLEWKCINFDGDFTEVCSWGSKQQFPSIGLDNGLAPARRQAIIWTNEGWFTDAYMRHSAWMS